MEPKTSDSKSVQTPNLVRVKSSCDSGRWSLWFRSALLSRWIGRRFYYSRAADARSRGRRGIVDVGKNVTKLRVGQRVAVNPTRPCFKCDYCFGGEIASLRQCSLLRKRCSIFSGEGGVFQPVRRCQTGPAARAKAAIVTKW